MKIFFAFFLLFAPIVLNAQVNKSGYGQFKWGQLHAKTTMLTNCNSKLSGIDFMNCDFVNTDSLFLKKYKYIFCNIRFYKNKLAEIQFDINHNDLASVISALTKEHGLPIVKEKKHEALDKENQSTGYLWMIGDTQVFIINDGNKVPAICILSSISINKTYPENTLSLEKLIFE
jgi:hypothetical protein